MNRIFIIFQIFTILFLTSCEPKPPLEKEKPVDSPGTKGLYVLNEGLMDLNNSTLLYYDFNSGKITDDIFLQTNGRGLGDTGNDLKA
ncbi:MAG: YncE family protein, partial [Bacteroidales bacterium]